MKKNIVYDAADILIKQMEVLQKCNDSELENEGNRIEKLSKAAEAIAALADKQVKLYFATGMLPENNILVDDDTVRLANGIVKRREKAVKKQSLLIDEFNKH